MLMEIKKKEGDRKNQTIKGKMNWTLAEQLGSTVTPAGGDGNYHSVGLTEGRDKVKKVFREGHSMREYRGGGGRDD